jgi:hypothetical protein
MAAKLKLKWTSITTMRTKCRSIATFHRPIHSHWSLPLRLFLNHVSQWFGSNLLTIVSKIILLLLFILEYKIICFRYINTVVATRKVPLSAKTIRPRVVMKMDIEVSNFILVSLFVRVLMYSWFLVLRPLKSENTF